MKRKEFLSLGLMAGALPLFNIGCAGFGQSRARRIAAGDRIRVADLLPALVIAVVWAFV